MTSKTLTCLNFMLILSIQYLVWYSISDEIVLSYKKYGKGESKDARKMTFHPLCMGRNPNPF